MNPESFFNLFKELLFLKGNFKIAYFELIS
jgi:hypothetical protein